MSTVIGFFVGLIIGVILSWVWIQIRFFLSDVEKKPMYTNMYGATGPSPWPDHLMTGPVSDAAFKKVYGATGYTGTAGHVGIAGPMQKEWDKKHGPTGPTGPSYTFGKNRKKKK